MRTGYETVAPVVKELEKELGVPERSLELALGVAGLLFLALCFSRCCCRRREPPHKRLGESDEEEAGGGKPSPRRPKRRSDAMPFLPSNRSAAELELEEQVAELRLSVSKATELAEQVAHELAEQVAELERRDP